MPISKMEYGTASSAITITLASLANNAARSSTAVSNSTNLFLDAGVMIKITTGAIGVSSTGYVNVYAYGTVDGSTLYTGGATGTDAAHTINDPTNLMLLGVINANASATAYIGGPMSVARAFGGVLPTSWGIVIENKTGAALDATEGSHVKIYQGTYIKS
jgi:hypothetical protein